MADEFKYDVFLSHSTKDKAVVRPIAERLRADGLKVWLDEWEIQPGDNIPAKIQEGLENSRVLVLCMSTHAFESDWSQLEAGTFHFRDPLNKERRLIPLRLDHANIPGWLAQFSYINWPVGHEQEYVKLVEACRPNVEMDQFYTACMRLLTKRTVSERTVLRGLLSEIDSFSKRQPFNRLQFHWAIVNAISGVVRQRENYTLLTVLRSGIDECLQRNTSTEDDLKQFIDDFKNRLSDTLEALAANGAKNIESGDSILLYAHSESVSSALNRWLQANPTGWLRLLFCQCLGKSARGAHAFAQALFSANQIRHGNALISFVPDSAVAGLMDSRRINKVFLGAHQWGWLPGRGAWFTNTQGTLAIAATSVLSSVPVFVLVEMGKTQGHSSDGLPNGMTARRRNLRDNRPRQTEEGVPIEYVEITADRVSSRSIPFVLVTEQGEFACGDCGLRKRNCVTIDRDGLTASKRTIDRSTAKSEKVVLELLGTVAPEEIRGFQAPSLLSNVTGHSPWASVSMHCKAGVRMHDLIATLNSVACERDSSFKVKVETFRKTVREWAMHDILAWQSIQFQDLLRSKFDNEQAPYEFEIKLKEAVEYVSSRAGSLDHIDKVLMKDIETLGQGLSRRASVFLRDATLKNQILEIAPLLRPHLPQRCCAVGYFPLVDDQWCDQGIAQLLIERIPDTIPWDDVRNSLWQVDFELASRLTTREDDFIHVLAMEVFSLDYDEIVKTIVNCISETLPEHVHDIMLFRCFRAWARRLFYFHEEPKTFATRYRHESLPHYHRLMQTAAQKLRGRLGNRLSDFVEHTRPFGLQ
jgi:translation initiation factor 2B subunit (eIF-2B alpha/beta/delta family)